MTTPRRSTLAQLMGDGPAPLPSQHDYAKPLVSGALRAVGLQLDQIKAEASESRDLKVKIAAGGLVVDLDPGLIDSSFIKDRIPVDNDTEFEAFVSGIEQKGQQVPILVRPSPTDPGRYQAAYGHRRIRATARLGIPVRAIVKALTDVELVVAQAQENLARQDLTYIERVLLAKQLEELKFDRSVIMSALGLLPAELSRMLTIANVIPGDLIQAIGPAPKIGRPRWLQLADLMKESVARNRALAAVTESNFASADTNHRFAIVVHALSAPRSPNDKIDVKSTNGFLLMRVAETPRRMRLLIDNPEFKNWIKSRIPTLVAEFEQQNPGAET